MGIKKQQIAFRKAIEAVTKPLAGCEPYQFTYTRSVKKREAGKTLLAFFCDAFPHKAQAYWIAKINTGAILVNDKPTKADAILQAGWITTHTINNKQEPVVNTAIKLLYEDDAILVLNKPAPLPVHASGRFYKNTLIHILKLAFPANDYKIVHRLDANTTGVLVLAKHKAMATKLIATFEQKRFNKTYLAWVEGHLSDAITTITTTIGTAKVQGGARALATTGQQAETLVAIVKKSTDNTLVQLQPKSGRTNQLRLHLASIKHPIVGDYGYKDPNYFAHNPMTYPKDCLMLHAWKLAFEYQGESRIFEAVVPEKFVL